MGFIQFHSYSAQCDDEDKRGCTKESPVRPTVEEAIRTAIANGWQFKGYGYTAPWLCDDCMARRARRAADPQVQVGSGDVRD